jgi:adenosylmethionine-8-amino-7-oxononanoate aminotransferase
MAICDPEEGMHSLFAGLLPEHVIAPLPRDDAGKAEFERLLEQHASSLAGIIVEPLVQGAGGMVFHEPEVLRHLRAAADAYGLTLILDEIFTGFGRTGTMFAFEQAGMVPDIITLSKALTGGTSPLAATIVHRDLFAAFLSDDPATALMHGPTFMANPMGCAAANASLDLFEQEDRLAQARAIEAALREGLEPCRDFTNVVDVRTHGAVGVVQLRQIADPVGLRRRFIARGVWIRPFRDIVYLTPALTIAADELATLTGAICSVLAER